MTIKPNRPLAMRETHGPRLRQGARTPRVNGGRSLALLLEDVKLRSPDMVLLE